MSPFCPGDARLQTQVLKIECSTQTKKGRGISHNPTVRGSCGTLRTHTMSTDFASADTHLNPEYTAANRLYPVLFVFPDIFKFINVVRTEQSHTAICNQISQEFISALFNSLNSDFVLLQKIYTLESCRSILQKLFYAFGHIVSVTCANEPVAIKLINYFGDVLTELEQTVYCITDTDSGVGAGHINGTLPPFTPGLGVEWVKPLVEKIREAIPKVTVKAAMDKLVPAIFTVCRTTSLLANKLRLYDLDATDCSRLCNPPKKALVGSPVPQRKKMDAARCPAARCLMQPELLVPITE